MSTGLQNIDIPKIIEAAAKSELGELALCVIILGILAYAFFRKAPLRAKVVIYLLLLSGVIAFGREVVAASSRRAVNSNYSDAINRGNSALTNHQYAEAFDLFKQAAEIDNERWESPLGLGSVAYIRHNFVEAAAQYGAAAKMKKGDPGILNNLAMTEEALGDYAGAEENFSLAIAATREGDMYRTDLLYDHGRMSLLLWLQSGAPKGAAHFNVAKEDFQQFVNRKGWPDHFALYHLACISAVAPADALSAKSRAEEVARLLTASLNSLMAYAESDRSQQISIMRGILRSEEIEPIQSGYPVGCPTLKQVALKPGNFVDRFLKSSD